MENYDILTLENNKDYVVAKSLEYKKKTYLLLIQVDEDENLLDEQLIVEKYSDDNESYLKLIVDEKIYQIVSEKFAKMLINDLV